MPKTKFRQAQTTKSRRFHFGRAHRTHLSGVPHLSALLAGKALSPPPPSVDWTKGMPANLGMMLNDSLNISTCAALYHAMQVWSFNTGGTAVTQPDSTIKKCYVRFCGYNPKIPGPGPVASAQYVLSKWFFDGAPTGPDGEGRTKIHAFIEVDPRNIDDVKRTINDSGVAYVGFNVPESVMPPNQSPPSLWEYVPNQSKIIGEHAVVLAGYTAQGARVISWGQYYTMTWEFFAHFVDEVYAIADEEWVASKGTTPAGLTLHQLDGMMEGLPPPPTGNPGT